MLGIFNKSIDMKNPSDCLNQRVTGAPLELAALQRRFRSSPSLTVVSPLIIGGRYTMK